MSKEISVTMAGEDVEGLLRGARKQFRRVLRKQPPQGYDQVALLDAQKGIFEFRNSSDADAKPFKVKSRYGMPGSVLWVREPWWSLMGDMAFGAYQFENANDGMIEGADCIEPLLRFGGRGYSIQKRPSIHMPREFARLFLSVSEIRIERLAEITSGDAAIDSNGNHEDTSRPYIWMGGAPAPILEYAARWDRMSENAGWGFPRNPWVWVVSFSVQTALPPAPLTSWKNPDEDCETLGQ